MTSLPAALLFDLDGTLVDSIDLILTCFRHACRTELGRVPPDEEWIRGIGTPLRTQFAGFTTDEAQLDALVTTYRTFQNEHHDSLLCEYEGTRETLALLRERGHPMAVVTSKSVASARLALCTARLTPYFDVLVGADDCVNHKPHPEPVHRALQALGVAAERAIFVGDSPHDIGAGRAAGVVTVGALWGPFSREALEAAEPDYLIAHIRDFPPLVQTIEAARPSHPATKPGRTRDAGSGAI